MGMRKIVEETTASSSGSSTCPAATAAAAAGSSSEAAAATTPAATEATPSLRPATTIDETKPMVATKTEAAQPGIDDDATGTPSPTGVAATPVVLVVPVVETNTTKKKKKKKKTGYKNVMSDILSGGNTTNAATKTK